MGNEERGTKNGKMKNEKRKQNRERVTKLLKVQEFNSGLFPFFNYLFPMLIPQFPFLVFVSFP